MAKNPVNVILVKTDLKTFLDTLNLMYNTQIFLTINGIVFNGILWVPRFQGRANTKRGKALKRERDLNKIIKIRQELIEVPEFNKIKFSKSEVEKK